MPIPPVPIRPVFLPVVGTTVITKPLAGSTPYQLPRAKQDVQHADVELLTIHERVDPKPLGVEELRHLAQAAIGAVLSEATRVDVIEPPGLAGCRDPSEMCLQDDGRTAWDS